MNVKTNYSEPFVSVLLPIYKEPIEYIKESIESILNQTFKDFELLILCDTGIFDPYFEIINREVLEYYSKEKKVRLFVNEKNLGLTATLNKGLKFSRGMYIARMDADDVALPQRLEVQLELITKKPWIDLCGTRVIYIDAYGNKIHESSKLSDYEIIKRLYAGINPIYHPTWFTKRSFYEELGGYREFTPAEDYELLCRGFIKGKRYSLVNTPLLKYRINISQTKISSSSRALQCCLALAISKKFQNLQEVSIKDYLKCIEKVNKSKLSMKIDQFSLLIDKYIQNKNKIAYKFLKWFIFLISPFKGLLLWHNIKSLLLFKFDSHFSQILDIKSLN